MMEFPVSREHPKKSEPMSSKDIGSYFFQIDWNFIMLRYAVEVSFS